MSNGSAANDSNSPSTPPSSQKHPQTHQQQSQQTVPPTPTSDSPSRLTISIPDKNHKANQEQPPLSPAAADNSDENKKGGPLSPLATLSLGSPRFHRKKRKYIFY